MYEYEYDTESDSDSNASSEHELPDFELDTREQLLRPKYSLKQKIIEQLNLQKLQESPLSLPNNEILSIPLIPTLILDLDETLVHAIQVNKNDRNKIIEYSTNENLLTHLTHLTHKDSHMFIFYRPHLFDFLKRMYTIYNLIVYTNGTKEYAKIVLSAIQYNLGFNPIKKCYARRGNILEKFLTTVKNINPHQTIIIDDSIIVWPNDKKQIVPIQRFFGPTDHTYMGDTHLRILSDLLHTVNTHNHTDPLNISDFIEHVKNKYTEFIINKTYKIDFIEPIIGKVD